MPEPITLVAVGSGFVGVAIHLARRYFSAAKEVVDVLLGAVAFVIWLPIMLVCVVIIKVASKGPILLSQVRVGRDGEPFRMYKFRTMYADAEADSGPVWASHRDPRVVPACRWMRISHMDELPQIINVIKGEMSLVGPRPERPEILRELEKCYPDVRKRLAVKPGITGLAQIRNGYDASVDGFRHKLDADLEYIANRKWSLEFAILLRTLGKLKDTRAR